MNWRKFAAIAVAALLVAPAGLFARQAILTNGSMELGPGQGGLNPFIVGDWTEFFPATGNVERSGEANRTPGGSFAIKAFADTTNSTAGERQELVAQPGDVVTFTGWLYTKTGDKLGGTGQAGLRMSFHDGSGVRLD